MISISTSIKYTKTPKLECSDKNTLKHQIKKPLFYKLRVKFEKCKHFPEKAGLTKDIIKLHYGG